MKSRGGRTTVGWLMIDGGVRCGTQKGPSIVQQQLQYNEIMSPPQQRGGEMWSTIPASLHALDANSQDWLTLESLDLANLKSTKQ